MQFQLIQLRLSDESGVLFNPTAIASVSYHTDVEGYVFTVCLLGGSSFAFKDKSLSGGMMRIGIKTALSL